MSLYSGMNGRQRLKTFLAAALLLMGVSEAAFAHVSTVPEIDTGSELNVLTLVSGALLVLRGRRKA